MAASGVKEELTTGDTISALSVLLGTFDSSQEASADGADDPPGAEAELPEDDYDELGHAPECPSDME